MSEGEKKFGPIRRDGWDGDPRNTEMDGWENTTFFIKQFFESIDKNLKELGKDIRQGKVLEVGSGAGRFLRALEHFRVDVVGIDARPRGLAAVEGKVVKGRVEQMPFADETFETVIGVGIFDDRVYDQDTDTMAREIHRVLKKGGLAVFEGFPPNPPTGFTDVSRGGLYIWQKTGTPE